VERGAGEMSRDDIRWNESVFKPPKVVGYWKIIDLQVSASRKPNWFHRMMARALLGWEWRDKL
jgi:hypothetical protein